MIDYWINEPNFADHVVLRLRVSDLEKAGEEHETIVSDYNSMLRMLAKARRTMCIEKLKWC